jgi:hypothetical protein
MDEGSRIYLPRYNLPGLMYAALFRPSASLSEIFRRCLGNELANDCGF